MARLKGRIFPLDSILEGDDEGETKEGRRHDERERRCIDYTEQKNFKAKLIIS